MSDQDKSKEDVMIRRALMVNANSWYRAKQKSAQDRISLSEVMRQLLDMWSNGEVTVENPRKNKKQW